MGKYLQFIEKHERIIIAGIVICGGVWLGYRYFSNSAELAKLQYADAKEARQSQADQNKILANKSAKDSADYALLKTKLAIAQADRDRAIAQRDSALKVQQAKNDSLPLPELGSRWAEVIGAVPGVDVKPQVDGLLISSPASHSTVNMLEQVPVLQQNLRDKDFTIAEDARQLAGLQTLTDSRTAELSGCKAEIRLADQECKKQVSAIKAGQRKRNIIIAFLGAVAGFVLKSKL